MKTKFLLFTILLSHASIGLENSKTVSTNLSIIVSKAEGHELGQEVDNAWKLAKENKLDEALSATDKIISSFNKLFDMSKKQFCFQIDDEFNEYVQLNGNNFQRIDWAYKEAYQIRAYVYSESRNFEKALVEIDKIERIAPVAVGALVEKGYILGQMKKPAESYEVYNKANLLADKYKSQYVYKAAILRGMGFVLIEMGKISDAESKYKESLGVEPNNTTATSELKYIHSLLLKKEN